MSPVLDTKTPNIKADGIFISAIRSVWVSAADMGRIKC